MNKFHIRNCFFFVVYLSTVNVFSHIQRLYNSSIASIYFSSLMSNVITNSKASFIRETCFYVLQDFSQPVSVLCCVTTSRKKLQIEMKKNILLFTSIFSHFNFFLLSFIFHCHDAAADDRSRKNIFLYKNLQVFVEVKCQTL